MENKTKRLYRSRTHRMLGGVCGGLGEYFDIDQTLVRLATVLITFFFPVTFFAYLVLLIVIPNEPLAPEDTVIEGEASTASDS